MILLHIQRITNSLLIIHIYFPYKSPQYSFNRFFIQLFTHRCAKLSAQNWTWGHDSKICSLVCIKLKSHRMKQKKKQTQFTCELTLQNMIKNNVCGPLVEGESIYWPWSGLTWVRNIVWLRVRLRFIVLFLFQKPSSDLRANFENGKFRGRHFLKELC